MATNQKIIDQQITAINKHDAKAFAQAYAEDAVVYDPTYPEPLRGRAAIEKDMRDFLNALPDLHVERKPVLGNGAAVAFEAELKGTHKGPLPGPEGKTIAATNRPLSMPVAIFCRTKNGAIIEEHRYFDLGSMLKQLGASPAQAAE